MTHSLKKLLQESWSIFIAKRKPILILSTVFAIVMFGMQSASQKHTFQSMEHRFGDMQHMEELANRIENGDEEALNEMMMQMGIPTDEGEISEAMIKSVFFNVMKEVLPAIGLLAIGMMILSFVMTVTFLVLAVEESQDVSVIMKRALPLIVPMIGVWLWSFLRSFAWIPVIGIITSIIIGPRLALSSVILVEEHTGVRESVKRSHKRTKGYWGKIVTNTFGAGVITMVSCIILLIPISIFGVVSSEIATFLGLVVQCTTMAFGAIFIVQLSNTITEHPTIVAK